MPNEIVGREVKLIPLSELELMFFKKWELASAEDRNPYMMAVLAVRELQDLRKLLKKK